MVEKRKKVEKKNLVAVKIKQHKAVVKTKKTKLRKCSFTIILKKQAASEDAACFFIALFYKIISSSLKCVIT